MRRRPLAGPTLLFAAAALAPLAGCLGAGPDPAAPAVVPPSAGLIGPSPPNATPVLPPLELLGMVERDGEAGEWRTLENLTLDAPLVHLDKQEPGATGGGGTTYPLQAPLGNLTLWVQFQEAARLGPYFARWAVYRDAAGGFDWGGERPADLPFTVRLASPGLYYVSGQVFQPGRVLGTAPSPYSLALNVHWRVESSVHPFKIGQLPEGNTEEMTDKFPFVVDAGAPQILARTVYRGTYMPPQGTDVDLQLDGPDGKPARCASDPADPKPSPENARESLQLNETASGIWTMRVGAIKDRVGPPETRCDRQYTYDNLQLVPYTLDLTVRYG